MKTLNILFAIALFSSMAEARDYRIQKHEQHESCIKERWKLLKTKTENERCQETQPLVLKAMTKTYPLMDIGAMTVRYWQGEFVKAVKTTNTYEHSFVNVCTGVITFSELEIFNNESLKYYRIVNPNLSDDINQSFETAAMTEDEARYAMMKLESTCNE